MTSRDLVDTLLQRLAELCPDCSRVIAELESTNATGPVSYDDAIDAALRQHHPILARVQAERGAQARRLAQLRDLPLPQRILWIDNTPATWADPGLVEEVFALAREALPRHPNVSRDWAVTARALVARYPEPQPGHRLLAMAFEGNAHRTMGDYLQARPLVRAAVEGLLAEEVSDVEVVADIHSFAGSLAKDDSAFDQAIEHLETAADAYLQIQHSEGMIRVTMQLGTLYSLTDRLESAIRVERSLLAALDPEHRFYLLLLTNLALHLREAGRSRAARHLIDLEAHRLAELPEPSRLRVTWLQARLSLDDGDLATAEALFGLIRSAFARQPAPFSYAHASLELAFLYHQQGRPDAVATVASEALHLFAANAQEQDALAALTMVERSAVARALTTERLQRAIQLFQSGGRRRT